MWIGRRDDATSSIANASSHRVRADLTAAGHVVERSRNEMLGGLPRRSPRSSRHLQRWTWPRGFVTAYPTADIRDVGSAVDSRLQVIDQILCMVTVLLLLTVVIATLGIANTPAL